MLVMLLIARVATAQVAPLDPPKKIFHPTRIWLPLPISAVVLGSGMAVGLLLKTGLTKAELQVQEGRGFLPNTAPQLRQTLGAEYGFAAFGIALAIAGCAALAVMLTLIDWDEE